MLKHKIIIAGSKDYQQIYDRYQREGIPKQISIIKFCEQNGVPYKQYERWYKTSRGHRKRTMSDMMLRAVNYIENNWEELQTYRTDGKYDIDNLEAERSIRPWTVSRKNIYVQHICPQDYFTKVFTELRDGNRDYESLLPFNIALN